MQSDFLTSEHLQQMVQQFKYLGHLLTEKLRDNVDIEREMRALAVLTRRFANCSIDKTYQKLVRKWDVKSESRYD
ncbi:RNA-directed DNA polymerase from mobile element jockey [Operophtera brumata]|uniref:RNA-directed DNA polymerase from mobile element jockey n=1 Tax=Operophtera brumata TaxID=104452 RepID=A0A0L7L6U2_OPEBR|nr:RNA-directed DNA polymerase from mobile element jockey [Operophtera brumata]